MANTILIRRGSGTPTYTDFTEYELAYDYSADKLYIRDGNAMVEIGGGGGNSTATSSFLTGDSLVSYDGYIMTRGIVNENETGGTPAAIVFGNGATYNNDNLSLITAGATALFINSSGNVAIGGTTANRDLQVNGTGIIRLKDADGDPGLDFGDAEMQLRYRTASDKLQVYSYGTTSNVLTIQKSNGNVGIATESPSQKLEVAGAIKATGTGGFTIGNVAGLDRIQNSSNSFSFLTDGNGYANMTFGTVTAGTWQGTAIGLAYGGTGATSAHNARINLGLGTLAELNQVTAATIADNNVGAAELNVSGNGSSGQVLASDGDGSFSWVAQSGGNATTLDNYDSTRFFRRQGSASATVGPGWMTVATNTSGRRAGEILVTDGDSSDHGFIRIHWLRSYADSNFTVINCGGHQNRITGVRVLSQDSDNTYGEKVLQVYVTVSSSYDVKIFRMGDDAHYSDHTVHTPTIENSITGYSVHGNELTDLNTYGFAHEEGIQAGGALKVGGSLAVSGTSEFTEQVTMDFSDTGERLYIQWNDTTVGDIGANDSTWLRINQNTAKNIYTPRYIRADGGFFIDGSSIGLTGTGTLRAQDGTAGSPGVSFSADTNTGMLRTAADTIGFSTGGSTRFTMNNSGVFYASSAIQAGNAGVQIWDSTHGFKTVLAKDSTYTKLLNNDGAVCAYFGDSGDRSNYFDSGNHRFRSGDGSTYYGILNGTGLRIGTGATFASYRLDVAGGARITSDMRVEGRVLAAPGSASAPAYSFYSDGDLGMYRSGDNDLAFAANGGQIHYELLNGLNRFHKNIVVGPNNNNSKPYIIYKNGYDAANAPSYTWYYNNGTGMGHPAGNVIAFSTGSAERARITNSGLQVHGYIDANNIYVAHGGSDYNPNISFLGGSDTPGSNAYENAGIGYYDNSGTGSMKFFGNRNAMSWFFTDSDETLFNMASDGTFHAEADVVAYSQTTNSDRRLKENINPIEYGLKEVLKINPVKYKWIEKRGGKEDIGVIAQDIEKIIPEIVQENKALNSDEMIKSVDYGKMVAVLIKAVQEQQEQINELKEKLNG